MDYDQTDIATSYDKARALAPETRQLWQDLLSAHIDRSAVSLIIDLGCGTGRFSELLAAHFEARVIGIDPSRKMVDQARLKPATGNVVYRQGAAEALPLPDACADLVFMSMVFHHFADPAAVGRECRRVLRQRGHVCIRNTTRENDFPHRHFFPALQPLIEAALPARGDIRATFAAAGFTLCAPTRSWHGCRMPISTRGWPASGPMAPRSTRTMPLRKRSTGSCSLCRRKSISAPA